MGLNKKVIRWSTQSISQIKADILSFESNILYKKIKIEQSLAENTIIFLDRAVPDSIAYYMIEGLNPDDPIHKSKLTRYSIKEFFSLKGWDLKKTTSGQKMKK